MELYIDTFTTAAAGNFNAVIIQDAFKKAFYIMKANKHQKSVKCLEDMKSLLSSIITEMTRVHLYNCKGTRTRKYCAELLAGYTGIQNAEDLANYICSFYKELEAAKVSLAMVKGYIPTKRGRKSSKEKVEPKFKRVSRKRVELMDVERVMAVRTKNGNGPVFFYPFTGVISPEVFGEIKRQYTFDTGVNYYDVRPILYTTWVNRSPENQVASSER